MMLFMLFIAVNLFTFMVAIFLSLAKIFLVLNDFCGIDC